MEHSIKIIYQNNEVKQLPFSNGKYDSINVHCDKEGYVYAVDENNNILKNDKLIYDENTGKYSDGTLCDANGNIYAVDSDNVKYKLYEDIKIEQCDKVNIILKIIIDGKENNPNYFISDIDDNITYKKKWDCLELYINRNTNRDERELHIVLNHNVNPLIKRKITIIQSGDVCSLSINTTQHNITPITYEYIDELINKELHGSLKQQPQTKELLEFHFNVNGGNKEFFVKNIEQFIIGTKKQKSNLKQDETYDLNDNGTKYIIGTEVEEKFIQDEYKHNDGYYYLINGYKLFCDNSGFVQKIINSLYSKDYKENPYYIENVLEYEMSFIVLNENDVQSSIINVSDKSYDFQRKYKLQQVLRYFYENGEFEHIKNKTIFYDTNGDLINFKVNYISTTNGEQLSKNYVYEINTIFDEIEYIEKTQYDNGLNTYIENSKLIVENYGRLFLYGINSIYKIVLAHKNDLSKTFDLYLKYDESSSTMELSLQHLKTKLLNSNDVFLSEDVNVLYTKGTHRIYIEAITNNNIFVEIEKDCDWVTYKVINNFVYIFYKDNIYKENRNTNILIKIGNVVYKKIILNQEGFNDYKIVIDYNHYELKYNESSFKIKVNVYGGDKMFNINKGDCNHKMSTQLFYEGVYYNSYYLIIKPKINKSHYYVDSQIQLIHNSNNEINKVLTFHQDLDLSSIEYTVLCDNLILLDNFTTYYVLQTQTYPFEGSQIKCDVKCGWLSVDYGLNELKINIQKNYGYKRSTILKLTNVDFPSKTKFVKIIQKGTK